MKRVRVIISVLLFGLLVTFQALTAAEPPELVGMRVENAKFFPAEHGQTRGDFYAEPVHYRDSSGSWKDIDRNAAALDAVPDNDDNLVRFGIEAGDFSSLMSMTDDYLGVHEDAQGRLYLSKRQFALGVLKNKYGFLAPQVANAPFALCLDNKERIVFRPENARSVKARKDGNTIAYPDAWVGASLEYEVGTTALKENIILSSAQSPREYAFRVKAYGLTPRLGEGGLLEFVDSQGQLKAFVPAPFMKDANGEVCTQVGMTATLEGTKVLIKLSADREWLEDPKRAFPVVLDPAILPYYPFGDAGISEYHDDTKLGTTEREFLDIGTYRGIFVWESRNWILLKFDLKSLPTTTYIHSASLRLYCFDVQNNGANTGSLFKAHSVLFSANTSWNEATVTWNSSRVSTSQPSDPYAKNLPNNTGYWEKTVSVATVKTLIENPAYSMLLWTFDSNDGYIRRFHSKENTVSDTYDPRLTVYFSHIPEVTNVSQDFVTPDNYELQQLGFKDKLRYRLSWNTRFPYVTGYAGENFPCAGRVDFHGATVSSMPSTDTPDGSGHTVDFSNLPGSIHVVPFEIYSPKIYSWCSAHSCYDSADANTYACLDGPTFSTALSFSNFDFDNNPGNLPVSAWTWEPLLDGHIAPQAYPGGMDCLIRYATDTFAKTVVECWELGHEETKRSFYEGGTPNPTSGTDGFRHTVSLEGLKCNTTYQYRVTTYFFWDDQTLLPHEQPYSVTSATGQFTTTDISYVGFYEATRESTEPLVQATIQWQTILAEFPDTPISTPSYLYLGATPDRTTPESHDLQVTASSDGYLQTATIPSLSPGVTYYYRVGCDATTTVHPAAGEPPRSFTTPSVHRGAEAHYNVQWWDLGVNGKIGVNLSNGNPVAAKTFFALAGRGPALAVGCFYNGSSSVDSPLGTGWRMSYESVLLQDALGWLVQIHDDGSVHVFMKKAAGGYDSAPGQFAVVEEVLDGYKINYKDGSSLTYEGSGIYRLVEVKDRFGNAVEIGRNAAGRITTLRRSAADAPEVTLHYDPVSGYLDYILTKVDPATQKQYKVDFAVTHDVQNAWSELKFTQLYEYVPDDPSPEAYWTTYHHTTAEGLVFVSDPVGHQTTVNYWPDGKVNTVSSGYTGYDEAGSTYSGTSTLTVSYVGGDKTNVTDGRGNTTEFIHNPDGTVRTIDFPADGQGMRAQQAYQYNGDFQITQQEYTKTQYDRVRTKYEYDSKGNLERVIEDFGGTDPLTRDNTTVFTYEPKYNQVKTVTDARQYGINPYGVSTEYIYDPESGALESVEPRGDSSLAPANYRIEYDYYANYDLKIKRVYNTNPSYAGALPTITYEYGYNAFGQLEEVFYHDGTQKKLIGFYHRDMFGNLLYSVDANGTIVSTEYNKRLLPTGQRRPMKIDATTLSHVNSRLAYFGSQLQPLGETELPDPNPDFAYSRQVTYDALARPVTTADARGNVTTSEYDELGRLRKVVAPLNLITYYHYDGNGNMDWKRYSVQNGYSVVRHFYDALNRETSSFDPAIARDREFKVDFDLAGNAVTLYRGWNNDGTFLTKEVRTFDNLNRCTEIKYYNASGSLTKTVSTQFDRNGNATYVSSPVFGPSGTSDGILVRTLSYDIANRPVSDIATNSTNAKYNYSAGYAYGGGRLLSETLSGVATNYTYDAGGRMSSLSSGNKTFTFGYYPNGTRERLVYGINGSSFITATYRFDRAYRLIDLKYTWGGALLDFAYTYDEDGRITAASEAGSGATVSGLTFVDDDDAALGDTEAAKFDYPSRNQLFGGTRTSTYAYDALGRLTNASMPKYCNGLPQKTTIWGYDAMGNRTSQSVTDGAYSYYSGGETIDVSAQTTTTNYVYDPAFGNRTISGTQSGSGGSRTLEYDCDGLGNLIAQRTKDGSSTVSSTSSAFNELWRVARQETTGDDDKTVIYYYDGNGTLLREDNLYYFYNSSGVAGIVDSSTSTPVTHNYIRLGGQLLASSDGFFYLVNARGDVVALVSETDGSIKGYYTYDAYGELRATQKDTAVFNKFKFAGGLQSNTGNYVFGARLYAPGEGRWISPDPYLGNIADPLSLNRYAYCSGDPVNSVDPSGFAPGFFQAIGSLNKKEWAFVLRHPIAAAKAFSLMQTAWDAAEELYPAETLHNGTGDAFRHAYWSALLTKYLGADLAMQFLQAHEWGSENPPDEKAMDLFNNQVGIDAMLANPGLDDEEVMQLIMTMVDQGVTRTLRRTAQ